MDGQISSRPFQFRLHHLLWSMAGIAAILTAFVPIFRAARSAAHRVECEGHLKQIALAIQNYHDVHGQFPSAYLPGASGAPAHSWRVLIANYIESRKLVPNYSFAEPWNGPNNSKVAGYMPHCYRCPVARASTGHMANYVAVVGPGTMWPGTAYMRMNDLVDGTSNIIMVVEIANSDIHWMEPRDLPIEELDQWLDPAHRPTLLTHTQGRVRGAMVVYVDGHTEFLTPEQLKDRLQPPVPKRPAPKIDDF